MQADRPGTSAYAGARLVLFDAEGVLCGGSGELAAAPMGHDARVLDGGLQAGQRGVKATHQGRAWQPSRSETVSVAALAAGLADRSMLAVDLRASMSFRAGHIAG